MPEKDENVPNEEQEPKRTRDVPVPRVGEVTIPDEEPETEPPPTRTIHRRRPLPLVPQKPVDPKADPG
jgi:hypothetical protein